MDYTLAQSEVLHGGVPSEEGEDAYGMVGRWCARNYSHLKLLNKTFDFRILDSIPSISLNSNNSTFLI